jgi:hypothetical protein
VVFAVIILDPTLKTVLFDLFLVPRVAFPLLDATFSLLMANRFKEKVLRHIEIQEDFDAPVT